MARAFEPARSARLQRRDAHPAGLRRRRPAPRGHGRHREARGIRGTRQGIARRAEPSVIDLRSTVVACRNPHLAAERARKREDLLTATEALLAKTRDQVTAGRIPGAGKIGVRAGKIINRYKVAKHFILVITDDHLAWRRDQTAIDAEAALDAIYILRTPVPAAALDAPAAVTAYKNLARVERDFRPIKADDLDLRPIHQPPARPLRP